MLWDDVKGQVKEAEFKFCTRSGIHEKVAYIITNIDIVHTPNCVGGLAFTTLKSGRHG